MAEQPRWPRGTPVGPSGKGPGGGRFRDVSPDWVARAAGIAPLASLDLSVNAVSGEDWVERLVGRFDAGRYRPGRWEQTPVRQHMTDRWAMLVQVFIDQGESESTARQVADRMMADSRPPTRVYSNGPHEVVVELDREWLPEQEILEHLDRLLSQFPPVGPLRLSIIPDTPRVAGGLTLRSHDEGVTEAPIVVLSESVFRPNNQENIRATLSFSMPAAQAAPPWQYILTHEWGHVLAVGTPRVYQDHRASLSEYGQESHTEHVAEAFAEWFLSGGQTAQAAVLAYAEHYGWEAPRG